MRYRTRLRHIDHDRLIPVEMIPLLRKPISKRRVVMISRVPRMNSKKLLATSRKRVAVLQALLVMCGRRIVLSVDDRAVGDESGDRSAAPSVFPTADLAT